MRHSSRKNATAVWRVKAFIEPVANLHRVVVSKWGAIIFSIAVGRYPFPLYQTEYQKKSKKLIMLGKSNAMRMRGHMNCIEKDY